jgi:hypothetical protein
MNKDENDLIEEFLDEFDFDKVQKTMETLEWTWHSTYPETPSISQLRKFARYLMKSCVGHEEYTTASGGFFVSKHTFEGKPYYRLMFVVEEWDNYE